MSSSADAESRASTIRRLPTWRLLATYFRLRRGNFAPLVGVSRELPVAWESFFLGSRLVMIHQPELVETLLVKNYQSYQRDAILKSLQQFLGKGLLTNEGAPHLRQRRMIQPAFHKKRVDAYAESMVGFARARAGGWRDGDTVDLHDEMMKVTLSIIAKTMFNADVSDEAARVSHAFEEIFASQERYIFPWIGKIVDTLAPHVARRLQMAMDELNGIIYRIIGEHRAAQEDAGDLLSMLLSAQAEDDGARMSDEQVRDECITLFLAGHETTAVALTWTWYLLSQHPEIEARLHAEVDAVLGGRAATAEDVASLPYTRQVLAESMRLFPPVFALGRQALEDNQLGPYLVREGDTVLASQYVMNRQPEWFPDPDRFDPDRWTPERAAGIPKFAFLPFGGGARKCIGEGFAWMEGILLLATLAQGWQFRLKPGHRIAIDPQVTLRPRGGMPMVLHRRQGGAWN